MSTTPLLPPALQPWRTWLEWFEPSLAAQVGALVQRLHPLLGRFHGQRQGGDPEPDGLGDLRRRGPYDRLLSTEWLLAEELPDEFLRRAATGEHLFVAPRQRARQAERLIVALFDAGPLQLGAPRLAHLALWILLARRAAEAGGELRWGVLQDPASQLQPAQSERALKDLLAARSFEPATDAHAARWQAALAAHDTEVGECWHIGHEWSPSAGRQEPPSHQVRLRRDLSGESLEVALREGATERRMALSLPAAPEAVSLLKGRFDGRSAPNAPHEQLGQRLSLKRPPVISSNGRQVAVMLLDEPGMLVFSLARADSRKRVRPRRCQWSAKAQPLAAFFSGKQLGAVMSDSDTLSFWQVPNFGTLQRPPREEFHAAPGSAAWLSAAWLRHGPSQRLCLLDQSKRLVHSVRDSRSDRKLAASPVDLQPLDSGVIALVPWSDVQATYVTEAAGQLWLRHIGLLGSPGVSTALGPASSASAVWFSRHSAPSPRKGACAVRLSNGPQEAWRIHPVVDDTAAAGQQDRFDPFDLTLPPGWHAVGLVHGGVGGAFSLVAQATDRTGFFLCAAPHVCEPLYTSPSRVVHASVCPHTGLLALLTEERKLIAYAIRERALSLFAHGDTEPLDAVD